MSTLIACALLTILLAAYVFYPEKQVAAQTQKTRRVYLEERKAVIYDNLRDLSFEHRAGKYRDEEYNFERAALEGEAAAVMVELEELRDR